MNVTSSRMPSRTSRGRAGVKEEDAEFDGGPMIGS